METISCVPVFSSITDQTLCLSIGQTTVVSKLKVRWFVKQQVRNKWVKRIRQNPSLIFVLSGVSGGCLRQLSFISRLQCCRCLPWNRGPCVSPAARNRDLQRHRRRVQRRESRRFPRKRDQQRFVRWVSRRPAGAKTRRVQVVRANLEHWSVSWRQGDHVVRV